MWIPLYFVGEYAEMPLLPYYFALATLLPTVAVTARRLHDINKNAALYLIPGAVLAASGFFIGLAGAAVLVLCWAVLLIRLLSRETDLNDGFTARRMTMTKFMAKTICRLSGNSVFWH